MRATGIVRPVDELGRVVLPKDVRDALGLGPGARVKILTEDDGLIVLERADGPSLAEALEVLRYVQLQLGRHAKGLPVDWEDLSRKVSEVLDG